MTSLLIPWPLIVSAVKVIAGVSTLGLGYYGLKKLGLFEKKKDITIAVLGLKGCGKTTLQNYLRQTEHEENTPISGIDLNEIILSHGNKKIRLKKGKDVSGDDTAIMHQYENVIDESDHIIFITDSSRLITEANYLRKSRGLLNKINKKIKTSEGDKKLILIGSHRDLLQNRGPNKKIDDSWLSKQFSGLNDNIAVTVLINLTNKKDLLGFKKSLFS
ncbi:GTPase domain-containing protein [Christiangramia echinicola]|uniref:GTPase domain-containing protein n=1 Tax=Christiangramia echinicola TaxID=279359 RepID=UPI00042193DA|nr:GTPase domain-containing protein [Christiangramia echinicola]